METQLENLAVEMVGISKSFGDVCANRNVSFGGLKLGRYAGLSGKMGRGNLR